LPTVFRPNWADRITIEGAWTTDVVKARQSLAEERRGHCDRPRRMMEVTLTGIRHKESATMFVHLIRAADERLPVPVYSDSTKVTTTSSGLNVFCDTTYRRFHVGGRILIHSWDSEGMPATSEYALIATILPGQLTLASALTGSYPVNSRVYPTMDSEVQVNAEASFITDQHVVIRLRAMEVAGKSALPASIGVHNTEQFQRFRGLNVFDVRVDWAAELKTSVVRSADRSTAGLAEIIALRGSRPQLVHTINIQSIERATHWRALQFFDRHKGRKEPYYLVAHEALWEPVAITQNDVTVTEFGNIADAQAFFDYVAVVERSGLAHLAEILAITDLGGTWRIDFAEPIAAVVLADVRKVTSAHLVRNSSDAVKEEWETTEHSTISWRAEDLLSEDDVEIANLEVPAEPIEGPWSIPDLEHWFDVSSNAFDFREDPLLPQPLDSPHEPGPRFDYMCCYLYDVRDRDFEFINDPTLLGGKAHLQCPGQTNIFNVCQRYDDAERNNARPTIYTNSGRGSGFRFFKPAPATIWDPTLGFTLFIHRLSPKAGYNQPHVFVQFAASTPGGEMLEWSNSGGAASFKVDIYQTAGVVSAPLNITGMELNVGRPSTCVLRIEPGVSSKVWVDGGAAIGTAASAPATLPSNTMDQTGYGTVYAAVNKWLQVTAQFGLAERNDAYLHNSGYNAAIVFRRALTLAEMDVVGAYLTAVYGGVWSAPT